MMDKDDLDEDDYIGFVTIKLDKLSDQLRHEDQYYLIDDKREKVG